MEDALANAGFKVEQVSMEAAYRRLGEIVRRVSGDNEFFLLLKNGMPVAAVIDISEFERCFLEPNSLMLKWAKGGVIVHSADNGAQATTVDAKRGRSASTSTRGKGKRAPS